MATDRLQQLTQLLQESPGDEFLTFAIAKEHEKHGREAEALEWYLKLTSSSPDYVGTYYHLGKWYERNDKPEKAFRTYQSGMEVAKNAGDQHALSELAGAKLALGDEEDFE
jgi:tetratricopeptide (TPR) repeat protein